MLSCDLKNEHQHPSAESTIPDLAATMCKGVPSQEDSDLSDDDRFCTPRSMFLRELDAEHHLELGSKVPVLAHEILQTDFPAVDLLRGRLKYIRSQISCNIILRGLRSGTLERNGEELSENLFVWLPDIPALSPDARKRHFDHAFSMVQELLDSIYQQFMKWNTAAKKLEGWTKPEVIAEPSVYLPKPMSIMEQDMNRLANVEVTMHSLSAQVVKATVSCAAPAADLNRIISKAFGVPAANQRILHGTVILEDFSLPMYKYGILPPTATLSFITTAAKGTKIPVQAEKLHREFPIAAMLRGPLNMYFKHIKKVSGFDVRLIDPLRTESRNQIPEPHQAMFLWIPDLPRASSKRRDQLKEELCLRMTEDLLLTVYEDHELWAAQRNLPHPDDLEQFAPEYEAFLQAPPVSCSPANRFSRLVFGGNAKFWERCIWKRQHWSSPYGNHARRRRQPAPSFGPARDV